MYSFISTHKKSIGLSVVALLLIAIAWSIYYSVFLFHVVSTSPNLDNVSTVAPFIKVVYNKDIESSSVRITSNNVSVSSSVSGKTLTINILELMTQGKSYSISIDSIGSTSGDTIKNYVLQFDPNNNNSLTPDQNQAILDKQENNKSPVLSDPIFQYLPYSTLDYSLDGEIQSNNSIVITITIQLSAADEGSGRDAAIAGYKQEAMDYLTSLQGINLSKYTISTNVIDSD